MAKHLSTFMIAQMLHVDPGSVANWIDQSLLKAHRTPGGHRRVAIEDLLRFLREHNMPVPAELQNGPHRVLIVDDEEAVRTMISSAVRKHLPEYEPIEAPDGFHAGTILATMKPEVVVLDLRMPGMDGFEVCRLIKSQEETRHIEIIAMTAYTQEENKRRILECGARICLDKPLDIDELVREIRAAAEGHPA